jgi:DNA polymerase-1
MALAPDTTTGLFAPTHPLLVDEDKLDPFFAWLGQDREFLAFDTESESFHYTAPARLLQVADAEGGWAIPAAMRHVWQATATAMMRTTVVAHNLGHDLHVLEQVTGMPVEHLWDRGEDTYVMAHVANPELDHNLEFTATRYLGVDGFAHDRERKAAFRSGRHTWATVPLDLDAYVRYAVTDAVLTAQLYPVLRSLVSEQRAVVLREYAVAKLTWEMERRGLAVDRDYAREFGDELERTQRREAMYFVECGVKNPGSTDQMAAYFQAKGWEPKAFTDGGKPQLDAKVLKGLAFPEVEHLVSYKRAVKWKSAYVDGVLGALSEDGRCHPSINSLRAKTSRMAVSDPPLQQIPAGNATVRDLFVPDPGYVLASCDYSQMELRVAASLAGDEKMLQAFADDVDFHTWTAAQIFRVEVEEVSEKQRKVGKAIGLGVLYGEGPGKIAESLNMPFREAKRHVSAFWASYRGLASWDSRNRRNAELGKPTLSMWGRKLAPHAPYAATNAIVQGSSAEILKDALLELADAGLAEYVLLPVHDEFLLQLPEATAEGVLRHIQRLMTRELPGVVLKVDAEVYGERWGNGYRA